MRDDNGRFIKGAGRPKGWLEAVSKPHTEEHKRKISLSEQGRPSPMKGRKHSAEAKLKMSKAHMGKVHSIHPQSEETRAKISKASKQHWKRDEYRKKVLGRREMSGLEARFLHYIQKHNLPYKFVGNGEFSIGRKNPDFVNTNGKKIAIEVYWKKHKDEFRDGGTDAWKEKRSKLFAQYGWKILYFDGAEVNEKNIIRQLTNDNSPLSSNEFNLHGEGRVD